MNKLFYLLVCIFLLGCSENIVYQLPIWEPYDESNALKANETHPIKRMQYKLIQSKYLDKNKVWDAVQHELVYFSNEEYEQLKPLIYEQPIPSIQQSIADGALTYEKLTLWYLHRIVEYESDPEKTLHTIIALNADAVEIARQRDKKKSENQHPIYGMPILLKDNINTSSMRTTGGAAMLSENQTNDAFIVERLKEKGAIILGKANLSEWAYYFCGGCPVGYSAVGGQTLNPYGRMQFETGGSSSGSGVSIAANYAVAAVGTETSGSILSPSSKNSIVGLKPTIGLLSRSGIIPISSTLDTPGPMTKSVIDNAILLSAMAGEDHSDLATLGNPDLPSYADELSALPLKGLRLGANISYIKQDSLYRTMIEKLKLAGANIIEYEPPSIQLQGFLALLNIDMKNDLPKYMAAHASDQLKDIAVHDVVSYNLEDSLKRMPYGQARLSGILVDTTSNDELISLKAELQEKGRQYFSIIGEEDLDAVLSINNYNAGMAAVAKYPCLTIPMGYENSGEPKNLTLIGTPFTEMKLLNIGLSIEIMSKSRKPPNAY